MLERSPAEYGINSNPVFAGAETIDKTHPVDYLLREEILSSVWCPGCGIGTVVNAFVETLKKTSGQGTRSYPVDKICIVSGIGCTGKVADYLKLNSINATDGNAIHSAIKFKSENPDVKVVVFLNDVDFIAFGIDGFIEACQKDIVVIHINNFIYIITEHKSIPTTPFIRTLSENLIGRVRGPDLPCKRIELPVFELPFNIPYLADKCGARYVARWTPLEEHRLMFSITDALHKPGFSLIEVISPCLIYYANEDKVGEPIDRMRYFHNHTVIKHNEPTENWDIRRQDKIIIGKFVDR